MNHEDRIELLRHYFKEKEDFESKTKKFLEGHKKELASLQAKVDKLIKASAGKAKKASAKPAPAAPTRKKVIKKVAKATAKPGFKKTTKKATKKA